MARTKLEVQAFKGAGSGERPVAGVVGPARGKLTFYYDADTDKVYVARLASGVLSYDAITGGFSDPTTTRGDLIVRGASGVARLALGNAGQLLVSNGTDAVWGGIVEAGGAVAPLYSNANARPAAAASYAGALHYAADTAALSLCARTGASAYAWRGLLLRDATASQVITASDTATGITRPVVLSHESSGSLGAGYGVGLAFYEGGTGAASLRGAVDVVRESGGGSGLSVSLKASGAPDAAELLTLSSAGRLTTAETIRPFRGTVAQITGGVFIVAPGPACIAFATNGRKPGESAGNGTGVPCFYDGSGWFSFCDGAALAA